MTTASFTARRIRHETGADRPPVRRAGFATIAAILTITVVAAAVMAMTHQFRIDNNRTRSVRDESQLRQLLHAGVVEALAKWRTRVDNEKPPQDAIQLELPAHVVTRNASVAIKMQRVQDDLVLEVTAVLDGETTRQTVRFELNDGEPTLKSVDYPTSGTP